MINKSLVYTGILVACTFMSCSRGQNNQSDNLAPERHLFLLAGQSNMAGRGVVAPEDSVINERVLTLNRDGEWEPAADPIHFDKPMAGVGPGRTFGLLVADAEPDIEVGLIPAAVGGSPISSWQPGGFYNDTGTYPYDDAIERARRATESGELKVVLWHQGESDSNSELAPLYRERLIELINRLRSEFNNPDLPFLIGQIGRFSEAPWNEWTERVNEAHQAVARELDSVYFISTEGLGDKGDALHFSADAARELGRRYAEVYLNLYNE